MVEGGKSAYYRVSRRFWFMYVISIFNLSALLRKKLIRSYILFFAALYYIAMRFRVNSFRYRCNSRCCLNRLNNTITIVEHA